jgi:hypothetical protein
MVPSLWNEEDKKREEAWYHVILIWVMVMLIINTFTSWQLCTCQH